MSKFLAAVLVGVCCLPAARGSADDDIQIVVQVAAGESAVETSETLRSPVLETPPPRPSFPLPRGQRAQVAWQAKNINKAATYDDIVLHFFVVREKEVGQADVPSLSHDAPYEGALWLDFGRGDKANWKFDLKIDVPGSYLLRVETVGLQPTLGYERYAAMDLIVE